MSKSARTHTPTQLFVTEIMSEMLSAVVALSLFVLSADLNFHHYWFGGECHGFRRLGRGFRTTALDFCIQAGGFSIFIGFRGFRGSLIPIFRLTDLTNILTFGT